MVTPKHRARAPRHSRRRRDERRGRRHRSDREAGSAAADEEAARDARRRDRSAGFDVSAEVPPSSYPTKKPRLRSEVVLVRGCPWRFEPFNPDDDDAVGVPAAESAAVSPASSSSPVAPADNCDGAIFPTEEAAAPAKGGAGTAPSSSTAAPPATTTGLLFACQLSVPPPPLPLSSQAPPRALVFTAAVPPPMRVSTACPKTMKAIPSTSRPAYAIPAIPPFPIVAPPEQQDADPDELRRAKVQRFASLIAKMQQETDERYHKLLRSGQAPPEPQPPKPVVDEETLRRIAAQNAARKRFREALAQQEKKAQGAALFVQMARPEHLRALGIDKAMERVVSLERPRDENGAPVLSPEHPCSPLEKLGYFLKVE